MVVLHAQDTVMRQTTIKTVTLQSSATVIHFHIHTARAERNAHHLLQTTTHNAR